MLFQLQRRSKPVLICQNPHLGEPKSESEHSISQNLGRESLNVRDNTQPSLSTSLTGAEAKTSPSSSSENDLDVDPRPWYQKISPFNFLRDGTNSVQDLFPMFGGSGKSSLLFPQRKAGGLLGPKEKIPAQQSENEEASNENGDHKKERRDHRFPSWSTWKDWKKVTLDVYVRLVDRPRDSRVRLKQTIALLPVIKLKPVIDLAYRGQGLPPVAMHLDVKLLDCIKYRLRADGSSALEIRAKAPLSDPRFVLDVVYERDLATDEEGVKISFRAMQAGFLKAPGFGAGIKFPIQFDNGIKSTVRVKKYLRYDRQLNGNSAQNRTGGLLFGRKNNSVPQGSAFGASSNRRSNTSGAQRFKISGPVGMDLKLRCLEYR